MEVRQIGNIMPNNNRENPNQGRVYDVNGICPTLTDMQGGGRQPMIIDDMYPGRTRIQNECAPCLRSGRSGLKTIVAMRGRNPKNPSDGRPCASTEQRLEPNKQGICNTLTTVEKDNLLLEAKIEVLGNYQPSNHDASRVVHPDGLAPTVKENHGTVTAIVTEALANDEQNQYIRTDGTVGTLTTDGSSPKHNNRVIVNGYRIRKLTPKECWRIMDFTDEDFHKAEAVNSNTQLYKQAGNSIVKNCLVAIFGQMIEGKENIYREVN